MVELKRVKTVYKLSSKTMNKQLRSMQKTQITQDFKGKEPQEF
jgi:hypothetical protein